MRAGRHLARGLLRGQPGLLLQPLLPLQRLLHLAHRCRRLLAARRLLAWRGHGVVVGVGVSIGASLLRLLLQLLLGRCAQLLHHRSQAECQGTQHTHCGNYHGTPQVVDSRAEQRAHSGPCCRLLVPSKGNSVPHTLPSAPASPSSPLASADGSGAPLLARGCAESAPASAAASAGAAGGAAASAAAPCIPQGAC